MPIVSAAEVRARTVGMESATDEQIAGEVAAVEASLAISHDLPDPPTTDVKRAVVIMVAALWERRKTPAGITAFGDSFVARVSRFDPDVDRLLGPYRKWPIA